MSFSKRSNYAGLTLKNPLIAASAGTTKDADHAKRCEDAGFSAVVLKSIQEETINRYNPFPRFAVVKNGVPGFSSHSFYSYEQAFEGGIEEYAQTVANAVKAVDIPVIASLNCVNPESWSAYAKIVEQAGAKAVEIVPSCPVGLFLRENVDFSKMIGGVTAETKAAVAIPVVVKMSMQLTSPLQTAIEVEEAGADGFTMFNRLTGLDIDVEKQAPILHGGYAGHGGPWSMQMNLRWISEIQRHVRATISATGGATSWADVIKYLLAGASTAQICAAIYLGGYSIADGFLKGIDEYMERHGVSELSDLIGVAARQIVPLGNADRSGRYYAQVDEEACIACGRCQGICIYDAIGLADDGKKAVIDSERCDGCGLCPDLCPKKCISMHRK